MSAGPRTAKEPNALLNHWMERAGLSNAALARAVTSRAQAGGERGINPSEGRVRAWRNGETPRHPVPQLIADHIAERTGLPVTCADIGLPDRTVPVAAGPNLPWQPGATITAIAHITRSEMMVPHSRHSDDAHEVHAGQDLLTPLQHWATATPSALVARGGGRLGASDIEGIRAITDMFRDADNRHGGILSRKAVIAQMADANALLSTASYDTATGCALFSAVADLGSVAGWMTFDAGMHKQAQRIFIAALHAASEAGDKALGAHILQCMARQMSHLRHYDEALDLVSLAQYGARRQATPATRSMLAALEARFHAILGQVDESERAAGTAEELFTAVDPSQEPAHMAFFDEAELCATIGIAHQIAAKNDNGPSRTRRAEQSLQLVGRALALRPDHRVRSKAFDHLGLARTHLTIGEVTGAREETQTALTLFGTIGSKRVGDRLGELHDEAAPYATSPEAADLRDQIRTVVAA
ncbi:transcriptional regulator [Streptomyces genisteinicus]|uniref:Transcriptional regulator n=1 Tax=Streptomyces genisteinicus TaxID=2768068 RepID=A0A7H0I2R1_9ACTN|nr:transcriptional regulator [Streptomyces genisteinicus]QNP67077.1 transcriptional regulator [Streptomyces genisteinicus]